MEIRENTGNIKQNQEIIRKIKWKYYENIIVGI